MAPTVYVDDAESSQQGNSNLTRSSSTPMMSTLHTVDSDDARPAGEPQRRRRRIRSPHPSNDMDLPNMDQNHHFRPIAPAMATHNGSVTPPIHLSARAVVQHARETLANGLDVPLLNYASQIDSVQVYPHHISNINQPPTVHQNAISGRSSTRRSRGEAFNSYSNAREELHAVNHYLQREVIPSISEGKF